MRYPKGSLSLSCREDKFILQLVADSRYITRSQLFQFARLSYGEYNRPVFNWRIRRMVECGLLRKQDPPILGGDALYSIKGAGIQALERLGIYYLGASLEREQDGERFQIPHALELNEIRFAIQCTSVFQQWTPEPLLRVLSLSPRHSYAKVYDGIALLKLSDQWIDVAIEYERTLKSPAKYQKIRAAIESESRIKVILYLVPTDELFSSLMHEFWRTKKCVLLGMVNHFKRDRLNAAVYDTTYNRFTLQEALTGVIPAKTGT